MPLREPAGCPIGVAVGSRSGFRHGARPGRGTSLLRGRPGAAPARDTPAGTRLRHGRSRVGDGRRPMLGGGVSGASPGRVACPPPGRPRSSENGARRPKTPGSAEPSLAAPFVAHPSLNLVSSRVSRTVRKVKELKSAPPLGVGFAFCLRGCSPQSLALACIFKPRTCPFPAGPPEPRPLPPANMRLNILFSVPPCILCECTVVVAVVFVCVSLVLTSMGICLSRLAKRPCSIPGRSRPTAQLLGRRVPNEQPEPTATSLTVPPLGLVTPKHSKTTFPSGEKIL